MGFDYLLTACVWMNVFGKQRAAALVKREVRIPITMVVHASRAE